jgi:hypothetical protein
VVVDLWLEKAREKARLIQVFKTDHMRREVATCCKPVHSSEKGNLHCFLRLIGCELALRLKNGDRVLPLFLAYATAVDCRSSKNKEVGRWRMGDGLTILQVALYRASLCILFTGWRVNCYSPGIKTRAER